MNKTTQAKIFIIFLCAIVLSACAPDPRREASAFEKRTQAEQEALNQQQAREHAAALNDIDIQDAQDTQTIKSAILNSPLVVDAFILAMVMIVISIGMGSGYAIVGTGRAVAISAEFKANQVRLDPVTRQFPLLRQIHGTRWAIENPNTGQVLMLDEKNEPDRMLIAAMAAVQHTGVLAQSASKSHDAAGVSIIQPFEMEIK